MTPDKPITPKEDADRKKRINEHLKNGDRLLKALEYNAALVEIEQALILDPHNYYAMAYKGRILEGLKEKSPEPAAIEPLPPVAPKISHVDEVSNDEVSAMPIPVVKREFQRKLAAIMFTDMVNYTALTQKNEPLAIQLLEKHRRVLRPIFKQFGGEEIKTIGDAFLVEFVSVFQAVKCAISIQNAIGSYNAQNSDDRKILIRIGIHIGDVIYQEEDIIGDGVNIAARIQDRAEAGGICISQDVYNQIRMKEEFHTEDMGEMTLKNVLTPVRLYKVYTTDEAYRRAEEKALESAMNEGRANALNAVVGKYLEQAKSAMAGNMFDKALTLIFNVLAIDANNQEANTIVEKIRVERAKAFSKHADEMRSVGHQTFIDMYCRLLKRSWSDGSLSSVELTLLDNVRSSFQISNEEHREFEQEARREVYTALLQKFLELKQPTDEDTQNVEAMRKELIISDEEHEAILGKLRAS
ncbi:MAG: adenylate/guanylate cyclase domain-containing protein [Bacteroidota bacterium]